MDLYDLRIYFFSDDCLSCFYIFVIFISVVKEFFERVLFMDFLIVIL